MEFTYKNRKHIARIMLVHLVVILLLALSFEIWGTTYSESNLERIVLNQSKELKHCALSNKDNNEDAKGAVQKKQLLDTAFTGIIIACILLLFTRFIWIYRSKLFKERRYTLVSLHVRMDE